MRSLESRISALEQLKPAPNIVFVVRFKSDGSLLPLKPGQMYGKNVAFIQECSNSTKEWMESYVEPYVKDQVAAKQKFEETMQRARAAFLKLKLNNAG